MRINSDISLEREEQGGAPCKHRFVFLDTGVNASEQEPWSLCAESQHDMNKWMSAVAKVAHQDIVTIDNSRVCMCVYYFLKRNGVVQAKRPRWHQDDASNCSGCKSAFSAVW